MLRRAIHTLWLVLEELDMMWIPEKKSWRLNERHYGALQGLNKKETVAKHGVEQVNVWRRSYDIPPPALDESSEHYPGNDARYKDVPKAELPFTESLKTTKERFMPLWEKEIVPDIKSGKRLVIAAHGNTIRALVQHLDGISGAWHALAVCLPRWVSLFLKKGATHPLRYRVLTTPHHHHPSTPRPTEKDICELNVPTGVPLVYDLDADMKPVKHQDAIAPLQGYYLGDLEAIRAKIQGVANQTGK